MFKPPVDNTKSQYLDYEEVIKGFSAEKIESRYDRLLEDARDFIQEMKFSEHVICNEALLMQAVLGYFSDIKRLKDFHEIDKISKNKILAYEAKWLLRRQPLLQIKDSIDLKYSYCNERFVYSQILRHFHENEGDKGIETLRHENLKFFNDTLLYHLKFRDVEAQTLELMITSFLGGRHYQYILDK